MMRYGRSRIPGTGPAGTPALVLQAQPEAGLQVSRDGRLRSGADAHALQRLLREANAVLRPLFDGGGGELAAFYRIQPGPGFAETVELNRRLRAYDAVAAAYLPPAAVLTVRPSTRFREPALDTPQPPGPTRDLSSQQGYLDGAERGGIDARFAWTVPGGTGDGVTVVDIERSWTLTHEDLSLPADTLLGGWPMEDAEARSHGTSVVGMLAAAHNGRGVMGICPGARVRAASIFGPSRWDSASAIHAAAQRMRPGDIMQLELMRAGPNTPRRGRPDSQEGFIAPEWFPAELAAIRDAVRRGIIVVEAAGNGSQDLDDAVFDQVLSFGDAWRNPFGRDGLDSGAILVGAGAPPPGTHGADHGPDRSRLRFSNFGTRVDVQGWGLEVTTTGGFAGGADDLRPGPDERRWYTNRFNGTSSATPMVAGALACIQGMLRAAGRPLLTPEEARALVREEGPLQQSESTRPNSQRIGRRPDLRAYHTRVFNGAALADAAPRRNRRPAMGTKITITIDAGDDVTVESNGGLPVATVSELHGGEQLEIAELLADPQWKGPSLSFVGPDGERRDYDVRTGSVQPIG